VEEGVIIIIERTAVRLLQEERILRGSAGDATGGQKKVPGQNTCHEAAQGRRIEFVQKDTSAKRGWKPFVRGKATIWESAPKTGRGNLVEIICWAVVGRENKKSHLGEKGEKYLFCKKGGKKTIHLLRSDCPKRRGEHLLVVRQGSQKRDSVFHIGAGHNN